MGKISYKALDSHVLAVAVEGGIKDWAAYIGAVKGNNFDNEFHEVAENGTKLYRKIAELLFPDFAKEFTWRD